MKRIAISIFLLLGFLSGIFAQEEEKDTTANYKEIMKTISKGFEDINRQLERIDTNSSQIKNKVNSLNNRMDSLEKAVEEIKKSTKKKKKKEEKNKEEEELVGWKTGGTTSLNASQVSLTNWAAGGQNSVSGAAFVNLFAKYKKDEINLDNNLDLGYGLIQQGGDEVIKSDDKIEFSSAFGRNITKHWLYSALLNFKTQFAPGYNYPDDSVKISDFMAPGYLQLSLGIEYITDGMSFVVSPVTGKVTFVNDQFLADQGAYGVEPATYDSLGNKLTDGQRVRYEFGAAVKVKYKVAVGENIDFSTAADIFSNYFNNPENIDISWENVLIMKINSYLSANLKTHLIYDDDIEIAVDRDDDGIKESTGPRTQFKQVASMGFSYKF